VVLSHLHLATDFKGEMEILTQDGFSNSGPIIAG
jgi:hypothetical protein